MSIIKADARALPLKDESVQMCCTSPPYWGLRKYDGLGDDQLGLETTPEIYVARMVEVFREVRRVLKKDGVLWLNLADSYAGGGKAGKEGIQKWGGLELSDKRKYAPPTPIPFGLKPKDLVGIPWRVAFALQADGWYLRSDIIWAKPNPMPESVTDRPTKAHEYIFLLTKSAKYYYNAEVIREPHTYGNGGDHPRNVDGSGMWWPPGVDSPHKGLHKIKVSGGWDIDPGAHGTIHRKGRTEKTYRDKTLGPGPHLGGRRQAPEPGEPCAFHPLGRNKRSVWTINTQPYAGSHFATFPEEIPRLCVLAGSRPGDVVLDPFGGSGTTSKVALELGRKPVHIDLGYHDLAKKRCTTTPAMAGLM